MYNYSFQKLDDASKLAWREIKNVNFTESNHYKDRISQHEITKLNENHSIIRKVLTRCGKYLTNLKMITTNDLLSAAAHKCLNLTKLELSLHLNSNKCNYDGIFLRNENLRVISLKVILRCKLKHSIRFKIRILNSLPRGIENIVFEFAYADDTNYSEPCLLEASEDFQEVIFILTM